tara:strand:- start:2222 stop:6010 length:3789 start_codon:yes stop_codon:yes gene_type:complete
MVYDPATNEQIVATQAEFFQEISDAILNVTAEEILDGKDDFNGTIEEWLQFKQAAFANLASKTASQADEAYKFIPQAIRQTVELAYDIGETTASAELLSAGIQPDLGAGFQGLAEYAIDSLVDAAVNRVQNRMNRLQITRSVNDAYAQTTEIAAAKVLGGVPLDTAVEDAVDDLLEQGIKEINVGNRKMGIDAYAETSIRTIAGNAQVQGSIDRYNDTGEYLVWITDSPMECKLCRPFEGKILRTTEDLEKIPKKYHKKKSLEYAKGKGLFHPNCTHSAQIFIEGFSVPPKDTNDAENEQRRNKIRRLQKLERKNKNKAKFWKENGSPKRAALAKKRAAQYREQRRRFEALIERKSLGWFTGEDRLRRLAAANGVPQQLIEQAGGNLPALNKIAAKTGFDPRLTSARVRKDVDLVRVAPDVKDYGFDNLADLKKNNKEGYNDLLIRTQRYFEADVGQMNFLEDSNRFHQPPAIPEDAKKSKSAFKRIVGRKGKYKNEYGRWKWNDKKGKPEIVWSDAHKQEMLDDVEQFIQEEIAGGAERAKKQILAGGLPSSGKTFNLKAQGYNADKYVTVNPDRFKVRIILNKYGTKIDKRINKNMSDVFINDPKFGANSILTKDHPVYVNLKSVHPDIADDILDKTFDKSTLEEIREGLVAKTNIGDTGLYGLEAANIIHEESSTMTKIAQDLASEDGLNIIHDVTLGSRKPIDVIDDLVTNAGYEKPEIMFISYRKEEAVTSVIDRYLRGNFDNIESTGRGGRYVMSDVLEGQTKKVNAGDGVSSTLELLGRDAITDNEIFLAELLDNPNIAPDNVEDVRIINRYSVKDPDPRSNFKSVRLQVDKVNGKFVVRRQAGSELDGLAEYIEENISKKKESPTLNMTRKYIQEITDDDKKTLYKRIQQRKFLSGAEDTNLKFYASKRDYDARPKVVKNIPDGPTYDTDLFDEINLNNGRTKKDVILYRGITTAIDEDETVSRLATDYRYGENITHSMYRRTFRGFEGKYLDPMFDLTDTDTFNIKSLVNSTKKFEEFSFKRYGKGMTPELIQETVNRYNLLNNVTDFPTGRISIGMLKDEQFTELLTDVLEERGINVSPRELPTIISTSDELFEEFKNGEYYVADGLSGGGIYTTTDFDEAQFYATAREGDSGSLVMKMKLNAGTKIATTVDVEKAVVKKDNYLRKLYKEFESGKITREQLNIGLQDWQADENSILIVEGFQARVPEHDPATNTDLTKGYLIIFDRGTIEISDTPEYRRAPNRINAPQGERD